jgi:hypothetical protein
LLIGGNKNNACTLKRLLNSNQRLHHGSETILKSTHRICGDARLLPQIAYPPTQGRPGHSDLQRRDHWYLRRQPLVDNNLLLEYVVLQDWDESNKVLP